jgi:hypothetical protein
METNDAVVANDCCNEMITVLNKYYSNSPDMVISVLIYLVVRVATSINAEQQHVEDALTQAFQLQSLIDLEVPNDFVN